MKFDFVIGNPPYQDNHTSNDHNFSAPIYHFFMDAAFNVATKVELITPARFLFNAGATPKKWNDKMLSDQHFKVLRYAQNSETVFPGIGIAGGVAISYRDSTRALGPIIRFIAHKELASTLDKVLKRGEQSLSEHTYNENKFNLQNLYLSYPKLKTIISSEGRDRRIKSGSMEYDCFHIEKNKDSDICVLGVINNKRVQRYISKQLIELTHENLDKYKVIVPGSGPGAIGEVLATLLIGEPLTGYSQTFLGIGSFENKKEAENCLKYIKSKFARALLGILKVTQSSSREKWEFVPWQNFSDTSDINWNTSVEDIDKQLFKKYELNDEEIAFINKKVKAMN